MAPWIFISLGLIAVAGAAMVALRWKYALAAVVTAPSPVTPMTNRRALIWAFLLVALVFMTVGYSDMSLWFLPVVAYVAIWVPQVRRKMTTPRQSVYVAGAFTAAMITAIAIQIFVWGN